MDSFHKLKKILPSYPIAYSNQKEMNNCGKRKNIHGLDLFPASLLFVIFLQWWEISVMLQQVRESPDLKSTVNFLYVYLKISPAKFPGTILIYFLTVYYLTSTILCQGRVFQNIFYDTLTLRTTKMLWVQISLRKSVQVEVNISYSRISTCL